MGKIIVDIVPLHTSGGWLTHLAQYVYKHEDNVGSTRLSYLLIDLEVEVTSISRSEKGVILHRRGGLKNLLFAGNEELAHNMKRDADMEVVRFFDGQPVFSDTEFFNKLVQSFIDSDYSVKRNSHLIKRYQVL